MVFERSMGVNTAQNHPAEIPQKEARTEVEIEGAFFKDYVIAYLQRMKQFKIADDVESGRTSIELLKRKVINLGNIEARAKERQGEEFDVHEFLLGKAEEVAKDLMTE